MPRSSTQRAAPPQPGKRSRPRRKAVTIPESSARLRLPLADRRENPRRRFGPGRSGARREEILRFCNHEPPVARRAAASRDLTAPSSQRAPEGEADRSWPGRRRSGTSPRSADETPLDPAHLREKPGERVRCGQVLAIVSHHHYSSGYLNGCATGPRPEQQCRVSIAKRSLVAQGGSLLWRLLSLSTRAISTERA